MYKYDNYCTMAYTTFQKVDENDTLEMYHFKHDVDYPDANSKLKGIVVDKASQEVVCSTSMHTVEYDVDQVDKIPGIENIDWDATTIMVSEEGCFLRVYHHNDAWYISTHRKLDADESKWGSRYSFKTLFIHALVDAMYSDEKDDERVFDLENDFLNKLDKNYIYTFLIRNNSSNRIVCQAPLRDEPKLYFSGVYPMGDEHDYIPKFTPPLSVQGVPTAQLLSCKNVDELKAAVNAMSIQRHQGVIVFSKVGGVTNVFKVMCRDYLALKDVRNNCSNLMFRYAQVRGDEQMRNKMIALFNQFSYDFYNFENTVYKIALHICNQYVNRYVRKQYAAVTPLQYKVTKKVREWYLQNPNEHRVGVDTVLSFINTEQPIYIYKLVVEFDMAASQ